MKIMWMMVIVLLLSCTKPAEIDEKNVTRIISTLAADDMQGRMILTPGIKKASDFLVNEFKTIGLEYANGMTGYTQDFPLYDMKLSSSSVTINSKEIKEADYFFTTKTNKINWNDPSMVEIIEIGADATLRDMRKYTRNTDKNYIFIVDKKHEVNFGQYRNYFGKGARTMEKSETGNSLVVLGAKMPIKSINIMAEYDVKEMPMNNVAGQITGKRKDEIVLFSAHYDHLGIRKVEGTDSIFNGANDDASGTTAVVELARYFKSMGTPERTIMFVAFTAEESGGFGSKHFSEELDPDKIVAMFNIEMIGKPATDGPNSCWITGFERSTFGEILQKAVVGTKFKFYPDPYPTQNLFYRSDNATLARLGVPAHSLSTSPIDTDKDYHQASDEIKTLDLAHMTNTIKAIAAGARTIISGEATPTRVDKATVN